VRRAEQHDLNTKAKGSRRGQLGDTGLKVLRAIAFRFMNPRTGIAWPSYDTLCAVTKLCRQSVANAIHDLERAGYLLVTRRAGYRDGRIVKETNLYRLALEAPPLPDDVSLFSGGDSRIQEIRESDWDNSPVRKALDALADRIQAKMAEQGSA
jgi:hypothetical protein